MLIGSSGRSNIVLCLFPESLLTVGRIAIDFCGGNKVFTLQSGFCDFFRQAFPLVAGHNAFSLLLRFYSPVSSPKLRRANTLSDAAQPVGGLSWPVGTAVGNEERRCSPAEVFIPAMIPRCPVGYLGVRTFAVDQNERGLKRFGCWAYTGNPESAGINRHVAGEGRIPAGKEVANPS